MENKEMDCVLVNAVDDMGYVWSFTLRGNDLDELFEKIAACGLKFSKQGYSPSSRSSFSPVPSKAPVMTSTATKTKKCEVHDVDMEERVSKTSGKAYFSHFDQNEGICFGSGYKGKSY